MIHTAANTLRREPRARVFLLVYAQSALGTGAAIVALMVVGYQRWHSPWAITLVLVASFVPPGLLGPVFGALVDRYSRRWCAVAADVARAGAFAGIGAVHGIGATVALAFVAGTGTALFSPAALASLPSLVDRARLPVVTSLYGAINDAGRTLGPLLAALAFPLIGASGIMVANAITFAISALVLAVLPFGSAVTTRTTRVASRFLSEVREGMRSTLRIPVVRVVVLASTAIFLFAAMLNVTELLLARKLGASSSAFALLIAVQGVGVVAGSLSGGRRGGVGEYQSRYLFGAFAGGVGLAALSASPTLAPAFAAFLVVGIGNGLVVVHERLIFQALVPESLQGRAFALLETLGSWAFAGAYLVAGALAATIGTRATLALAGGGVLAAWVAAALALRSRRVDAATVPAEPERYADTPS